MSWVNCVVPLSSAVKLWPAPLKGMWTASVCVARRKLTEARWPVVPTPLEP